MKKLKHTKATILKLTYFSAFVATENCEFKKIPRCKDMVIGSETNIEYEDESKNSFNISNLNPYWIGGVLISFALLFAILIPFINSNINTRKVFTVIDVDINPSVSFSIDKNSKVLGVDYLNQDAKELLDLINFKNQNIIEAVTLLTQTARIMEYDSSFVLISGAVNQDYNKNDNEEMLSDILSSITESDKMKEFEIISQAVKVSGKIKVDAKKNGISLARQAAYEHSKEHGQSISMDQIKDSLTADIFLILTSENIESNDITKIENK